MQKEISEKVDLIKSKYGEDLDSSEKLKDEYSKLRDSFNEAKLEKFSLTKAEWKKLSSKLDKLCSKLTKAQAKA